MLNQFAKTSNDFSELAVRMLKIEKSMHMFFEEDDNAFSLFMLDPNNASYKEFILPFLNTMKFYLPKKNGVINGCHEKSQLEKFLDALKQIKATHGSSMSQYLEEQNPGLGAFLLLNIEHVEKVDSSLKHYFRGCLEFDEVATRVLKIEKLMRLSFEKENELSYFLSDPINNDWKQYLERFSELAMKHLSTEDEVVEGYVEKNQFSCFMDAFSKIKETKGFSLSLYLKVNNPDFGTFLHNNIKGLEMADETYKAYFRDLRNGKSKALKKS